MLNLVKNQGTQKLQQANDWGTNTVWIFLAQQQGTFSSIEEVCANQTNNSILVPKHDNFLYVSPCTDKTMPPLRMLCDTQFPRLRSCAPLAGFN